MKFGFTREEVLKDIRYGGWSYEAIGRQLGCSRQAARNAVNRWKSTSAAFDQERGKLIDKAQDNIAQAVQDGDLHQSRFVVRTIGKNRGWTERQEIDTGEDDHRIDVYFYDADPDGKTTERGHVSHESTPGTREAARKLKGHKKDDSDA